MFKSTRNKGFQMTFDNDWTISVQFGYVNYCSNRNHPEGCEFNEHIEIVSSSDAEIAIWNDNGDWYDFDNSGTVTSAERTPGLINLKRVR